MKLHGNDLERFHRRLAGEALCDLAGVLGRLIPARELTHLRRSARRKRVFTPMTTFWSFLAQVLNPGQPCRETVRRVQAVRQRRRQAQISARNSGYCQARRRLPTALLERIWQNMARNLTSRAPQHMLWMGLRVAVIDGTTVSMPDTPENQVPWPQSSTQKLGCGFPVMKLLAVFSLVTGAVHALATGSLHNAEHALLQPLWTCLAFTFDLVLGDRNFGSFTTFCTLRALGLHGVFRLHQRRNTDWRKGQRLGKYDRLVLWPRPQKATWLRPDPLPYSITVRILKINLSVPGFRTKTIMLATNLLDPKRFSPEALAQLYLLRWRVELFFAHIKNTMHMDILRCRTPEMILRELHMHLIAYNAIRTLMFEAAVGTAASLDRISFKGTCDALRQWSPHLAATASFPSAYRRLFGNFLLILVQDTVPLRPNRSEPRAVKRRPKNFQYLNKPRHQMGNLPHRNNLS